MEFWVPGEGRGTGAGGGGGGSKWRRVRALSLFRYCRKEEKRIDSRESERWQGRRRIQRGHSSHDIKRGCRPSETRGPRPTLKTPVDQQQQQQRAAAAAAARKQATSRIVLPAGGRKGGKKCEERAPRRTKGKEDLKIKIQKI